MRYSHIEPNSEMKMYGDFTWEELGAELATHRYDEITIRDTRDGLEIAFCKSNEKDVPLGYCTGLYLQLEKDGTFLAGPIPTFGGDS